MSKREKPDFYSQKAQKEGYPARSVYKLEEIQKKMNIIKKGDKVLDVGASPGSWSLYVSRLMKKTGDIIGVDLKALNLAKQPENLTFLQGDIFDEVIQKQITETGLFDVIISDAAPSTTGNRTIDCGRSYSLCEQIIYLADSILKPGGNVVMKIFQGGDEQELLKQLRQKYKTAKALKPKATRKDSFETFFIGIGKK